MKEKENVSTLEAFKAFVAQFASGENNIFCGYEHAKRFQTLYELLLGD